MHEIIYFIGLLIIGVIQYIQNKKLSDQFNKFEIAHNWQMQHLRSELKVPEPVFHVKHKKVRNKKPQVVKRTEEDEYERELPPGSGEKRA